MKTQVEIMHEAGFVTAAEAATLLGARHVGTIHRMVARAELEGERVGSRWYVRADSLLRSVATSSVMRHRVEVFMTNNKIPKKKGATRGTSKR